MTSHINLFGMKVTEVTSRWKIIIFFIYTGGLLMVPHFNKWIVLFMIVYGAFSYNALVMGEVWQWTTGQKNNRK